MTCNPAVGVFGFPSPNSSHTSSPTHASDVSNSSLDSVLSDEEDNIDNIIPTLPPLAAQSYQPNDFRMINNEFGSGFSCTNSSLGYYPMVNGSCSQSWLNVTGLQRGGGLGYSGGGSESGMYQGMPCSGVTSNIENLDHNSDGKLERNVLDWFLYEWESMAQICSRTVAIYRILP